MLCQIPGQSYRTRKLLNELKPQGNGDRNYQYKPKQTNKETTTTKKQNNNQKGKKRKRLSSNTDSIDKISMSIGVHDKSQIQREINHY